MAAYVEGLMDRGDPVLAAMEAFGHERHFPLVGPEVGRILHQLTLMTGARRVFELGSGFGYSAYWFARALPEGGEVHCTDAREENAAQAGKFFAGTGLEGKLHFHVGDALESFRKAEGPWDIVFNDVDKHDYPEVLEEAMARLRPGGLFISDNTLWHGRVLEGGPKDKETEGIRAHNRTLFGSDERWYATLLPVRDGLTVAWKRG